MQARPRAHVRGRAESQPISSRSNVRDKVPLEEEEDQEEEDGQGKSQVAPARLNVPRRRLVRARERGSVPAGADAATLALLLCTDTAPVRGARQIASSAHSRDAAHCPAARQRSRSPVDSFADDWNGHRDVRRQLERGATKWAIHGGSEQVDGSLAQVPALEPIGEIQDELYPPKNFAMVYQGVFRSAYPTVRRCLQAAPRG